MRSWAQPLYETSRCDEAIAALERAHPMAERAVAEARHLETWLHGVGALRVWGMVEASRGNDDRAARAYEEGLRRARAMPFPYAEMQLLHASGLLERQRGDTTAGQTKLTEALAIAERLGATRDIETLRLPRLDAASVLSTDVRTSLLLTVVLTAESPDSCHSDSRFDSNPVPCEDLAAICVPRLGPWELSCPGPFRPIRPVAFGVPSSAAHWETDAQLWWGSSRMRRCWRTSATNGMGGGTPLVQIP